MDFLPVRITELMITSKCNMNCTYCFERDKTNKSFSKEMIDDYIKKLPSQELMVFGGEPFLNIENIEYLYDSIMNLDIDENAKNKLIKSFTSDSYLITNGTLIDKHIDVIKKMGMGLQISLDGPEDINDTNRIYTDGTGTFKKIMENIQLCIDNNIPWTIHGAIGKQTIKHLERIFDLFWQQGIRKFDSDYEATIRYMGDNILQIIFEDNYSDDDINEFLVQQENIFYKILEMEYLSETQKTLFLNKWFKKRGASCIAGNSLIAIDTEGNQYPCHRLALLPNKKDFDIKTESGLKTLNSFINLDRTQQMYSVLVQNTNWNDNIYQYNWCPSTNLETSGTVYYQSAKYNLLIKEYDRFVDQLFEFYNIKES